MCLMPTAPDKFGMFWESLQTFWQLEDNQENITVDYDSFGSRMNRNVAVLFWCWEHKGFERWGLWELKCEKVDVSEKCSWCWGWAAFETHQSWVNPNHSSTSKGSLSTCSCDIESSKSWPFILKFQDEETRVSEWTQKGKNMRVQAPTDLENLW